jgi:ADP-ribose 1''-phosphate phosphatase
MGCWHCKSFQDQSKAYIPGLLLLDEAYRLHVQLRSAASVLTRTTSTQYPAAYKAHNEHCKATPIEKLIGTCQLIPPQEEDYSPKVEPSRPPSKRRRVERTNESEDQQSTGSKRHWIACLFTSRGYGKPTKKHPGMDKPEIILEQTRNAVRDLRQQLAKLGVSEEKVTEGADLKGERAVEQNVLGELWSCKFNSGLFAVEWADTRKVLEELKGFGKTVRVMSPATA